MIDTSVITIIIIILIIYLVIYYINIFNLYILGNNAQFDIMSKIDRYFNLLLPKLYLNLSDIFLFIVMIYGIYLTYSSNLEIFYKILISLGLLVIPFILIFPMIHVYNTALGTMTSNTPMNLDKNKYFKYHTTLEDSNNFKKMQTEVTKLLKKNNIDCFNKHHLTDLDDNSKEKCWKWFPLLDQNGWNTKNCQELPFLSNLLVNEPSIVSASISIIEPGMKIPPHRGYMKSILRYHLGVIIPTDKKPFIVVGGNKYYWKEGEGVMFDDMFVHYVENPSAYRRAVLFIDVLRNDIPYPFNKINEGVYYLIANSSFLKSYDSSIHNQESLTQENSNKN